jgi:hypothetical protein
MLKKTLLLALIIIMAVPVVNADRRKFVWTQQYVTIAPGAAELEFYQTTKLDELDSWEYRIEVETGLTPNTDFAVYQIFSQKEGESFKWDAFQIELRHKLAQPGEFFMDPLLYLEYKRKTDLKAQNKFEAKLVLSKDIEKTTIAINPVYEFFWAPGDPIHELGLDIGVAYASSYKFSFGFESTTRYEILKDEDNETGSYFGPTISFASGPMFYTFGYAWGLTDDSNDARARFIMGVEL